MNIVGAIAAFFLIISGHKPHIYSHFTLEFDVGENWGGCNLGIFFLCNKNATQHIKMHQTGHAIQNAAMGIFFPFVVAIPSFIRYWYRQLKYYRKGLNPPTAYDDIWFEGSATRLGTEYCTL